MELDPKLRAGAMGKIETKALNKSSRIRVAAKSVTFEQKLQREKMTPAEKRAELEASQLADMKKVLASKALQLEKLFKEWDEVSLARAATTCT